jgi:hypothetical protein
MRARRAVLAVFTVLSVGVVGVYFWEDGNLNPFVAPRSVDYEGCEFHPTQTIESLAAAIHFEHNATAYTTMPVRQVARAVNGMAIYALPLGPGAYPCSAAPMDTYLEVSTGSFQLYRRCCGP